MSTYADHGFPELGSDDLYLALRSQERSKLERPSLLGRLAIDFKRNPLRDSLILLAAVANTAFGEEVGRHIGHHIFGKRK